MSEIEYERWRLQREDFRRIRIRALRQRYSDASLEDLDKIVAEYEGAGFLFKALRLLGYSNHRDLEYEVVKDMLAGRSKT